MHCPCRGAAEDSLRDGPAGWKSGHCVARHRKLHLPSLAISAAKDLQARGPSPGHTRLWGHPIEIFVMFILKSVHLRN